MYNPCRLWYLVEMKNVVRSCVILHKIIADSCGYAGMIQFRELLESADEQCAAMRLDVVLTSDFRYEQSVICREYLGGVDEKNESTERTHGANLERMWGRGGVALLCRSLSFCVW